MQVSQSSRGGGACGSRSLAYRRCSCALCSQDQGPARVTAALRRARPRATAEHAWNYRGASQLALSLRSRSREHALRQPNMPGTIAEHPNWRYRYEAEAASMLDETSVRYRIARLV